MPGDPLNLDDLLAAMEPITRNAESRNRDYLPNGAPVRSPVGALYAMQTMPKTAGDPGFGVRPAASNTPAEYNRVGKEYLAAMTKRYGDPQTAWAAYNWGPGHVDRAKAAFGENWLAHAPASVRSYARSNAQQLGSRAAAPASIMDQDPPLSVRPTSGQPAEEGGLAAADWSKQMTGALDENAQVAKDAAAQRKAMYEQGLAALQQRQDPSDRSRFFSMLSQAFLSPTSAPGFKGVLQNLSSGLNGYTTAQHDAEVRRAQALMQLQQQYGEGTIDDRREAVKTRVETLKALKPSGGNAIWSETLQRFVPRDHPVPVKQGRVSQGPYAGGTAIQYSDGSHVVRLPTGQTLRFGADGQPIADQQGAQ